MTAMTAIKQWAGEWQQWEQQYRSGEIVVVGVGKWQEWENNGRRKAGMGTMGEGTRTMETMENPKGTTKHQTNLR
jgi:hypothetical protein